MDKFIINKNANKDNWSMPSFHSHNQYEIYLLTSGTRDLLVNNQLFTIKENTVLFIPPFVAHKTEGGSFERTNYFFSLDFLSKKEEKMFYILSNRGPIVLTTTNDNEIVLKIFKMIEDIYNKNDTEAFSIIHSLITTILVLLTNNLSTESTFTQENQLPQDIVKTLSYIHNNLKSEITASFLAKMSFFSTAHFCKRFKKYIKCSFSDYVLNLRLTEAKKLLQLTNEKIERIAEDVGFSSANYFSLIFKKKVGMSPQSYRLKNRVFDYSVSNKI